MPKAELKGKIKTLTQGKVSDNVVDKMAITFQGLVKHADFKKPAPSAKEGMPQAEAPNAVDSGAQDTNPTGADEPSIPDAGGALPIAGLVYTINIQLPESRDQAVYDALFKSLRAHLTH